MLNVLLTNSWMDDVAMDEESGPRSWDKPLLWVKEMKLTGTQGPA